MLYRNCYSLARKAEFVCLLWDQIECVSGNMWKKIWVGRSNWSFILFFLFLHGPLGTNSISEIVLLTFQMHVLSTTDLSTKNDLSQTKHADSLFFSKIDRFLRYYFYWNGFGRHLAGPKKMSLQTKFIQIISFL